MGYHTVMPPQQKLPWHGKVIAVQPRIRLLRSFDQRQHNYPGYILRLDGTIGDEKREFMVAVGKGAHAKHSFRAGDELSGESVPVADPRLEVAEFYKTSRIKFLSRGEIGSTDGASPPLLVVPPALEVYRERGHRRLDARTYASKCTRCIWGCRMPVEMTIDQWNPANKRYRFETFCYGPKSCPLYSPGPNRKVPGRKGMVYLEEDWVDEQAVAHRGPDE